MVKTPCFQCRGRGFDPWSGNLGPTAVWCGKKKKISFISKTKHGLRDSGLGFGGKRSGLEAQSSVSMVPTPLMPLVMLKSELEACFLLERVSGPASAPWLDQQV